MISRKGLLVPDFVEFVPADLSCGFPPLLGISRSFLMGKVCRKPAVDRRGCFLSDDCLIVPSLQLVRMSCHRSIVDFNIVHDVITSFHESVGSILFIVPLHSHINWFVCVE